MASPRTRAEFAFTGRFESPPKGVVFAPGRVNLIGEHVDHQGGFVLPLALPQGVAAAWSPRPDRAVRVIALDAKEADRFTHGAYVKSGRRWADLVRGCCAVLEARGTRLPGVDLAIAGDVPPRKGLGSSGAFVTAVVRCLLAAGSRDGSPAGIARIAQEVEAKWAGVRCGAMDPYVAALGKPGVPILLDCLHLTHEELPWPDGVEAVPVDTGIARDLATSPYNERRAELEAGVALMKKARPGTQSLRDWSLDDLDALEDALPAAPRRRLRHALTEMTRVRRAADALKAGDGKALGAVLNEGHESLSSDFEASTPAIDAQAAALRSEPGVLGVRLQGAGFGGCLVVLREKPPEPPAEVLLEELPPIPDEE